MYLFAYSMQQLALFCAIGSVFVASLQLYQQKDAALRVIEIAQHLVTISLTLASAMLLHALFWNDFSVDYVASYTDRILPVFYRLTAFWAGQAGSLLFWALSVSLCGSLFALTPTYKKISPSTRLWFWVFFGTTMAFFSLLLTSWSNPFILRAVAPADGNGLNPLLQNPGMIFHPPLLFLGYGGFVIPGCLALAQNLSGMRNQEGSWTVLARPFTLLAWLFLTAGIILGAWWAYMELGWGGYWAWDPVENASIIPWLLATAALHTIIVEERRGKLSRVNVCLMSLTTISAFFATYLVRSGVIDSVHAFGDGGVGTPLLVFILMGLLISFWASFQTPANGKELSGLDSREGFLVLTSWLLISLSLIILVATMWPVITKLFSTGSQGLTADFYNRVCLPLCAALIAMLAVCPWLSWTKGLRDKKHYLICMLIAILAGVALWFFGYRKPTPFIATIAAIAVLTGVGFLFADARIRAQKNTVAAFGVHFGLALLVIGTAFSGAYKQESDITFSLNEKVAFASYEITMTALDTGTKPGYEYLEASLEISKDGKKIGTLKPQRRIYEKFGSNQYAEADTIPSLVNELYASLLGLNGKDKALVKISKNPLVNWLWIGGTLMCLFPFLGCLRRRREREEE